MPFSPYIGNVDTLAIPEAVQALEGYGEGVPGYPNTVDLENGTYTSRTRKLVLDGTETWYRELDKNSGNIYFYLQSITPKPAALRGVCSHCQYAELDNSSRLLRIAAFIYYSGILRMRLSFEHTTIDQFKAYLAEQYAKGTPVTIVYAVEETITDISDILNPDNFIQVQGAGYITTVNEHKLAVSSETTYQCLGGA